MKIKLLVVEDEQGIRDMIRFALPETEFHIVDAENSVQAAVYLAEKTPDLVLVDWMLPGKSGLEFIQWIKQQDTLSDVPIIMLTAKAEEEYKVKGLMTGADDYITKPFSPNELIARIKTVLRRGLIVSPTNELKCQQLILNIAKSQASIQNHILKLSPIEYKTLYFFMRHPNRTYTRDQLITHIWGRNVYIDDRTVDTQIRRLRDKLKLYQYENLIRTIRGIGYQFTNNEELK